MFAPGDKPRPDVARCLWAVTGLRRTRGSQAARGMGYDAPPGPFGRQTCGIGRPGGQPSRQLHPAPSIPKEQSLSNAWTTAGRLISFRRMRGSPADRPNVSRAEPVTRNNTGCSMDLTDLLAPDAVLGALKANGKKQALQELAARAATLTGLAEREIFDTLLQREKLGSTGVGHGVAIPHGRMTKLDKLFGLFARLDRPVDFEALDGQPIDLVFVLLAPEGAGADHLKALARIARLLRDQDVAKKLRASRDAQAIYSVLALPPASAA